MQGFERESALRALFCTPAVRKHLAKWQDFMAIACLVNPGLCEGAYERRPCERKLRYIGHDNFDEPVRSGESDIGGFVYGHVYHSVDFNGATYTIRETGNVIGMTYFEVVCDE